VDYTVGKVYVLNLVLATSGSSSDMRRDIRLE
jgi:hypothetical protein